ncbi:glycosyltransferase, partial [Arthrobacter stackebrandtii]
MAQWQWQKRWRGIIDTLEVVPDSAAAQRLLDRLATPDSA